MSHKTNIPNHPRNDLFKKKNTLYWYLTRYLIERISDYCQRRHDREPSGDGTVRIVFSRRGGMNYEDFRSYLRKLQAQQNDPEFDLGERWKSIGRPSISTALRPLTTKTAPGSKLLTALRVPLPPQSNQTATAGMSRAMQKCFGPESPSARTRILWAMG